MENIISRPFHCDKNHYGMKQKALWGTNSQQFIITPIYGRIKGGITPHIISWKAKEGKVYATLTCGIIGCGCELKDNRKLVIKHVSKKVFEIPKWNALILFKDTGFEI